MGDRDDGVGEDDAEAEADVEAEVDRALAAAELPGHYFDLYQLAVEMADRVSVRRGVANSFFLTANTGLVALVVRGPSDWLLGVTGVVVSVAWWALLKSYRDLNNAKFTVILAMEERLPVRVFGDEWERLTASPDTDVTRRQRARARLARYRELGWVERLVPCVFALLYLVATVRDWCT